MRVPIFETTGLEQEMFENPQDNEGLFAFAEACQDADSQQVPSWQLPDIMSRGSLLSQIAAKKAILATLAGAELSGFKIHNPPANSFGSQYQDAPWPYSSTGGSD